MVVISLRGEHIYINFPFLRREEREKRMATLVPFHPATFTFFPFLLFLSMVFGRICECNGAVAFFESAQCGQTTEHLFSPFPCAR